MIVAGPPDKRRYPEDNTFRPTENFDRGGLAKMVAYFSWGGSDLSKYYQGANVFADVDGYAWAKGSINFGYNAGYINGYADGGKLIYNPEGTVKGSELAKVLLCLMGYKADAKDPAYALTGANWELNAIRLAQTEKLFANLSASFDPTAPLTREEAAQMFANLLLKKVASDYDDNKVPLQFNGSITLTKYFSYSAGSDGTGDFGRPNTTYKATGKDDIVINNAPVYTTTTAVTGGALYTALGRPANATHTAVEDGTTASTIEGSFAIASGNTKTVGAQGVLTEVYKTDAGYTIVMINTYVDTIKAYSPATTNADGEVTKKAFITLNNNSTFETDAFTKADADAKTTVLYTKDDDTVKSVVKAASFDGVMSEYDKVTRIINGTTYNISAKASSNLVDAATTGYADTYTYYVDSYNNLIKSVKKTDAGVSTFNYAYVLSYQAQAGSSDLIGATANVAKAEVILSNGTKAVVDVDIYQKSGEPANYYVKVPAANGTVTEAALADATKSPIGNWFSYVVNTDGTYTFSAIVDDYAKVAGSDVTMTEGKVTKIGDKYTTVATTLTIVDTKNVVSNATGLVAATLTYAQNSILYTYAKDGSTVTAVYAVNQATAPVTNTANYAYVSAIGRTTADGVKVTYSIKGADVVYTTTVSDIADKLGTVVDLTLTDGIVTAAADVSFTVSNKEVTLVESNFIVVNDTVYYLTADSAVYNITAAAAVKGAADTLEKGDTINVVIDNNGNVVVAYIIDAIQ